MRRKFSPDLFIPRVGFLLAVALLIFTLTPSGCSLWTTVPNHIQSSATSYAEPDITKDEQTTTVTTTEPPTSQMTADETTVLQTSTSLSTTMSTSQLLSISPTSSIPPTTITNLTAPPGFRLLKLPEISSEAVAGKSYKAWKPESGVEIFRQPNMAAYRGKTADSQPLKGITVIVDPGHGGIDPGTYYPYSGTIQIREKDIVFPLSLKLRTALERYGATVVMTRTRDETHHINRRIGFVQKALYQRAEQDMAAQGISIDPLKSVLGPIEDAIRMNTDELSKPKARGISYGLGASTDQKRMLDLALQYPDMMLLSVHVNSLLNNKNTRGLQVYYSDRAAVWADEAQTIAAGTKEPIYPFYPSFCDAARRKLAETIRNSVLLSYPELKFTGYHSVLTQNFGILREVNLTSVLIEVGFIDNAADRQLLTNPDAQNGIAEAIARAVWQFYCA